MDVNPYESPASAQEAGFFRAKLIKNYFTIYRAVVLGLCAAVLGMSLWQSYLLSSEIHFNRDLYVLYLGIFSWAMLAFLFLSLRFLYLLIQFRFQQAAIDGLLVLATFFSIIGAQSLVPVSV